MARWMALGALVLAGCGQDDSAVADQFRIPAREPFDPATLPAPEVFAWGSQPISVSPPIFVFSRVF